MSACSCCPQSNEREVLAEIRHQFRSVSLFNRVTVLLLSGWVGIVTLAMYLAADESAAVPPFETFIGSLF